MTKSSAARVSRRKLRQGVEEELRRRGITNPDSSKVREWVRKKVEEKEAHDNPYSKL